MSIQPVSGTPGTMGVSQSLPATQGAFKRVQDQWKEIWIRFTRQVSPRDVAYVTRTMAVMLKSGIPLERGLSSLAATAENPSLKEVLTNIVMDLRVGRALSLAMGRFPRIFSPIYTTMVAVGEKSGELVDIFENLADFQEKEVKMVAHVKSELTYPIIIIVVTFVFVFLLGFYFLPHFSKLFEELRVNVPWVLRMAGALSTWIANFYQYLLGLLALGYLMFRMRILHFAIPKRETELFLLKLPLIKIVLVEMALVRFLRGMRLFFRTGLPIIPNLRLLAESLGLVVLVDEMKEVANDMTAGRTFSASFANVQYFPRLVASMMEVGENTGEMEQVLERLEHFYIIDLERKMEVGIKMLEPLLMLFLGLVVGFILVSVLLPLYTLIDSMKAG